MTPALLFDLFLAALLAGVAWRLLASPDPFKAVVLFIVFGMLTAVAWIRLGAPDLALAEAAIGAGVTGALFLGAIDALQGRRRPGAGDESDADAP